MRRQKLQQSWTRGQAYLREQSQPTDPVIWERAQQQISGVLMLQLILILSNNPQIMIWSLY